MNLQTKADFTALMHKFLDPLKPYYSAGCARLHLGETGVTYNQNAIELEAFSRPLWALVPFWVGGGSDPEFEKIYRKGLATGADPENPEYWGTTGEYDQCYVEMAAIACGILTAPEKLWTPLSDTEKQNLAAWLGQINAHTIPDCNWQFFRIFVNLALKSVGMPYSPELLEDGLCKIDSYYSGDGWSTDGASVQKDYYIPWAIQYYGLLYSKFAADTDPRRAALYRQRAQLFAQQFVYWFDANGAALPFGRSLTYRFAQNSFWAACIWAGLEPLPLPVMKGIIVRNLNWWLAKPIFDRDGVLTIGYGYPQQYMAEQYNAPGSPYWGLKVFLLLALPEDHPFWTAEAAPLPAELAAPGVVSQPCSDLLLQRLPDGQLNAYSPANYEKGDHGQFVEKYGKFVYSTRFGFSASRSYVQLEQAAPDSMLAFVIDGWTFVRRHSDCFILMGDRMLSRWSPFPGIRVTTELIPTEWGHIRSHTIESTIACTAYDCGFAVPKFAPGFTAAAEGGHATAQNDNCSCTVQGAAGEGFLVNAYPNTNVYDPNTVIPAVRYDVPIGTSVFTTTVESWYK